MADPVVPEVKTPAAPEIPVQETIVQPIKVATEAPIEADDDGAAAPAADPAAAAPAAGEEQKVEKLPEWAQKVIKDNAFQAREAKREAKRLADELAKRPAAAPAAPTPSADDAAAAREAAPVGGYRTQAEFDEPVRPEANRRTMADRTRAQAQEFGGQLDTIWNKGVEKFKTDFDAVADNLNAIGVLPVPDENGGYTNDAFMRLVMATDNPAEVLHAYGSNPVKAQALMALSPERRAIEIAKMDVAVGQQIKTPAPASKVPRPVETVDGSVRVSDDPRDDDSDEAWFAKREKQLAARRA